MFRLGGDEFMVFLPGLDEAATREVADRYLVDGPAAAPVSLSLGWAVREGRESLEETLLRADRVLTHTRVQERQHQLRR